MACSSRAQARGYKKAEEQKTSRRKEKQQMSSPLKEAQESQ